MVKPQNLGDTLVVTGPVVELSQYLVRELMRGDLVLSNMPNRVVINTSSELSTHRLTRAAAKYPGIRVIRGEPNVQSKGPHR